ncbi:type I addiction module toxin, SymE family [Escherichia coli]|uniref:SymE family type I addiction module toxin n=1 Tax=Escherichia coli TaxID=562 RepID=UPI000CFD16C4|nr:SymE family type I addiction module toxin [Escherichia coli]EFH6991414.1 type I addiction module toxin, SymE family [Escherichia coli]
MAEHDSNTAPDLAHSEFYSYVDCRSLCLHGEWMPRAGFTEGMPVKIRVMRDCIIITPQHTRELWGCIEGMSITRINKQKVTQWIRTFPGAPGQDYESPLPARTDAR